MEKGTPDSFDDAALNDPGFALIARAILDGTPVRWNDATSSPTPADDAMIRQFRVLEDLVVLHRLLPGDAAGSSQSAATPVATDPVPRQWGSLTILECIGSGAFGDVFRARDNRLDREVALKLLRAAARGNEPRATAAIDEGRLLARIRHPNVVTVYGAECFDERIGIWTEFIHGRTLAGLVRENGPLRAPDAAAIGMDLCRALSAVHGAGLVHRDIKPQNVMREDGGRLVLLDFGAGREQLEETLTGPAKLTGTPLYLAPEVWQGAEATPRSDIYSTGVLLFHLVTGDHPVRGGSIADIRQAHANGRRTRLRDMQPDLPDEFIEIVERALAADPSQRFDSAGAFQAALEHMQGVSHSGDHTRARRLAIAAVAAGVLIAAVAGLVALVRHERSAAAPAERPFASSRLAIQRVTFTGDARYGTISPNGKFVAYSRRAGGSGVTTLWVHQMATGTDAQIASFGPELYAAGVTITADSESVDLLVGDRSFSDLLRAPVAGGPLRKIVTDISSAPGWSPDGRHFAFVRVLNTPSDVRTQLVVADADGSNQRVLATYEHPPGRFLNWLVSEGPGQPAWSPDGTSIAVLTLPKLGVLNEISVRDASTGLETSLHVVDPWIYLSGLQWLDQSRVIVNHYDSRGGSRQIWMMDLKTGESAPLTQDVADYRGLSLTSDRRVGVSGRVEKSAGIWLGSATGDDMVAAVPDAPSFPSGASIDNQGVMVYRTETDVGSGIWIRAGRDPARLLSSRGQDPVLSPDGKLVVFCDATGDQHLAAIDVDGSRLRQLTDRGCYPLITPDGQTVLFLSGASNVSGPNTLWAVPIAGGRPREITHRRSVGPSVSPDGHLLMFRSSNQAGDEVVLLCNMPDCTNEHELHLALAEGLQLQKNCRFAPDSQSIGCVNKDHPSNVWVQSLDGGAPRQLTHFPDRDLTDFAWSPDGKRLAVTRRLMRPDIVLLTGFK